MEDYIYLLLKIIFAKLKKNYYSIISDIIEFYSYLNFNDFTRYCGAKQSDKQNLLI